MSATTFTPGKQQIADFHEEGYLIGVRLFCDDLTGGEAACEGQAFTQSDGCCAQRSSGEMAAGRKLLRRRTQGLSVLGFGVVSEGTGLGPELADAS